MLQQLQISNYTLIDDLTVDFDRGFSVITGETGAGKSLLLGALGFVLGDRSDANVLFDKEKKCVVEASFSLNKTLFKPMFDANDLDFEDTCTFRRELTPQKKSRAFINDTPVTIQTLKDIGSQIVDIHSQHDSLLLTNNDFQLHLLDEIAQNHDLLEHYKKEYAFLLALRQQLDELKTAAQRNDAENDFLKFQLDELEKAQLKEGEYEEIEQTLHKMENAEEIKALLATANTLVSNSDSAILMQLNELSSTLRRLKALLPETSELEHRIEAQHIELKDIAYDLDHLEQDSNFDEEQMQKLQERYDLLNRLMMKHHVSDFAALITLQTSIAQKVSAFENIDEQIDRTERALTEKTQTLDKLADSLHLRRAEASRQFEDNVSVLVRQLAMPHAVFNISVVRQKDFSGNGADLVRFLFSANKGMAADDIGRVASGGELSRLMLSIKSVVSRNNYIPTLIFDEIDTGVSGEVAAKVGDIMNGMADSLQLVAITHLPQVASKARQHFFIYKDSDGQRTRSHIRLLNLDERVMEIAKMLSNDKVTAEALKAAEVLLK
ncbi:MAG: DNA repair protein RecN [Candidatus Limimorpha sp.]